MEKNAQFKVNIGNLPPKNECLISLKYATVLQTEGDAIRVNIPITGINWYTKNNNNK